VKIAVASVGGAAATVGAVWGLLDAAAVAAVQLVTLAPCVVLETSSTEPAGCKARETSDVPWILAGAGLMTAVVGLSVPSDPLSRADREALISGGAPPPRVGFGVAPTPGGGAVFATARF
jgi:hypothetical protein